MSTGALNSILGNSLYNNPNSGIFLASGANGDQAAPVIEFAKCTDTSITITAQAPALPVASNFRLEFFVNREDKDSITEGKTFIGSVESIESDEQVAETFAAPFLLDRKYLSATATNFNNTDEDLGDTSVLSENAAIVGTIIVSEAMEAISGKYY